MLFDRQTLKRRWLFAAFGLCVGLGIAFGTWAVWPNGDKLTQADIDAAIAEALAAHADVSPAVTAFDKIAPSLVTVRAFSSDAGGATLGTGFVFNDKGDVLTANHLIDQADNIELTFADGTGSQALILSIDVDADTAVLGPVNPSAQPVPAVIANSRTLQVGDPVLAIGNPLGLETSLTGGMVSGLERSFPFPLATDETLGGLIQFDAAVNPGSAGGPLVNVQGHVIGLITVLPSTDQGDIGGIGFAVPIDVAARANTDEGPAQ